jgi:hypothetical protein
MVVLTLHEHAQQGNACQELMVVLTLHIHAQQVNACHRS